MLKKYITLQQYMCSFIFSRLRYDTPRMGHFAQLIVNKVEQRQAKRRLS